jgi:acetyl-CoA decarbonylase/synthase complex subunit gamma
VKKSGIAGKVKHRKLIIPGYAAVISESSKKSFLTGRSRSGPREGTHPGLREDVETGIKCRGDS